jgi:phage repressor protein C with HTH and peptisase S24 domain
MTISHDDIWAAIDALAARHGLSASGLARRAGLDPTAFNRSKRVAGRGRRRWPTTESLSKILAATGTSTGEFVALLGLVERKGSDRPIPFGPAGFHDGDGARSALRAALSGDAPSLVYRVPDPGLPPLYRRGDRLLLDLDDVIVEGVRALVLTTDGIVTAGEVVKVGARGALAIAGQDRKTRLDGREVAFAARIIWASQ